MLATSYLWSPETELARELLKRKTGKMGDKDKMTFRKDDAEAVILWSPGSKEPTHWKGCWGD